MTDKNVYRSILPAKMPTLSVHTCGMALLLALWWCSSAYPAPLSKADRADLVKCLPSHAALLPPSVWSEGLANDRSLRDAVTLALDDAAESGDVRCATLLLEIGAAVEGPFFEDRRLQNFSPLMKAVSRNHVGVAKALLAAGANVNLDWGGLTPLHEAAAGGGLDAVRLLLKHGARVDAVMRAQNDFTPLHSAVSECRYRVVELLLEHGADRTAKTHEGETLLDMAERLKCPKTAAVLR
jgi:hypothetical protein